MIKNFKESLQLHHKALIDKFIEDLSKGSVCLHPTDTLPGLSFDPRNHEALDLMYKLKKRPASKSCISLVHSAQSAFRYWENLPQKWQLILENIWPAPLTVIWFASKEAPKGLVYENSTLSLRVPLLNEKDLWLHEVLKNIDYPLPSTSVNIHGESPCVNWEEAKSFLIGSENNIHIPNISLEHKSSSTELKPSTIIEIQRDSSFRIIRNGSFDCNTIQKLLNK